MPKKGLQAVAQPILGPGRARIGAREGRSRPVKRRLPGRWGAKRRLPGRWGEKRRLPGRWEVKR